MSAQAPRNVECQDFYLGCKDMTEDNTGARTTVEKGHGEDYTHTLLVAADGFVKKDDDTSYTIRGGKDSSLSVTKVVASKGVKIKEDRAHKEVYTLGGAHTQTASTVVEDSSEVTVEGMNKVAVIRSECPGEGAIVAEKINLGSKITLNEENPMISVSSGTKTTNS